MEDFVIKEGIHFVGKPCRKCGTDVRYVNSGKCALCTVERTDQRRQSIKEEHKDKGAHYVGDPCIKCGNYVRYVNNGECVLCKKEWSKQQRQKRKEEHNFDGVYYEGNPCVNCGNCTRYVCNTRCVLCNAEHHKQRRQKRKGENRDSIYFEGMPCKKCGSCVRYVSNTYCVRCSVERQKQWQQNNPEKVRTNTQRRRALKLNAEGSFTTQEWLNLCDYYGNKCIVPGCENTNLHADHIVPLSEGGSNWITNIQPLCGSHNSSKYTKTIDYRNIQSEDRLDYE